MNEVYLNDVTLFLGIIKLICAVVFNYIKFSVENVVHSINCPFVGTHEIARLYYAPYEVSIGGIQHRNIFNTISVNFKGRKRTKTYSTVERSVNAVTVVYIC